MKTNIKKIGLMGIAIVIGIALNSFTIIKTKTPVKVNENTVVLTDWDEYNKVHDYVRTNISDVLRASGKINMGNNKMSGMSRCPSGYNESFAQKTDSVKADRVVYGKINYYRGCSPNYICDFKVCVNTGTAEVKTKDMKEFVPVKEWLGQKDKPATATVVKG